MQRGGVAEGGESLLVRVAQQRAWCLPETTEYLLKHPDNNRDRVSRTARGSGRRQTQCDDLHHLWGPRHARETSSDLLANITGLHACLSNPR